LIAAESIKRFWGLMGVETVERSKNRSPIGWASFRCVVLGGVLIGDESIKRFFHVSKRQFLR
jgi:hypothetical protein